MSNYIINSRLKYELRTIGSSSRTPKTERLKLTFLHFTAAKRRESSEALNDRGQLAVIFVLLKSVQNKICFHHLG